MTGPVTSDEPRTRHTQEKGAAFCSEHLASAARDYLQLHYHWPNPTQIPRSARGNQVRLVTPNDWTSGFIAGSFWYLYEYTRNPEWLRAAESQTQALAEQRLRRDTHDIGFAINNSFGLGYRITGNTQYAPIIIEAAESLAARYNSKTGTIRSWDFGDWTYPVIIDNMMNLELLFHASRLSGNETYAQIAVSHARMTLEQHFRPDFSSYHVVDYDPTSGSIIAKQTNQGLRDDSAWARGQAWGLYGFTMAPRESGEVQFLQQAMRIAEFYTRHEHMPADGIPYFDFDAPRIPGVPLHRDASAAAIATSALLELARMAPCVSGEKYRAFALRSLESLSAAPYRRTAGSSPHFLLNHSVGNFPIDDEVNVSINYADYYYIEALVRYFAECTSRGRPSSHQNGLKPCQ